MNGPGKDYQVNFPAARAANLRGPRHWRAWEVNFLMADMVLGVTLRRIAKVEVDLRAGRP